MIRSEIGPIACSKVAVIVPRFAKTRSGKILRSTMRKIADGGNYMTPSAIDDPRFLAKLKRLLIRSGTPRKNNENYV